MCLSVLEIVLSVMVRENKKDFHSSKGVSDFLVFLFSIFQGNLIFSLLFLSGGILNQNCNYDLFPYVIWPPLTNRPVLKSHSCSFGETAYATLHDPHETLYTPLYLNISLLPCGFHRFLSVLIGL